MPVSAVALFAQAAQPDAGSGETGSSTDIVRLILDSDSWLANGVLLILLLFSAISWGVTLYKIVQYRRAARHTAIFLDVFRKSSKFSEVQAICPSVKDSPLVGLFQAGHSEVNSQMRQPAAGDATKPAAPAGRPTLRSLDAVDRALMRAQYGRAGEAGTPRAVSRDRREHHPVHRIVRYRLGDHELLQRNRCGRVVESRRRGAGDRPCVDRDGRRASSPRFRPCISTTPSRSA